MKLKAFLLALVATLGISAQASAVITDQVWVGWVAGEWFQAHCQARNTQTTDYLHWYQYTIMICNLEATDGYSYYDHVEARGDTVLVRPYTTSVSNVVVRFGFACPSSLFASNRVDAFNIPNGRYYTIYAYDSDGVNCWGDLIP